MTDVPQDLDAERAAIGSMLLSSEALTVGADRLSAAAFMQPEYRLLFPVLVEMHRDGTAADYLTVKHELDRRGLLDKVGGVGALAELAESVPSAESIAFYCDILERHHRRRGLLMLARKIDQQAGDANADPAALIDDYKARLEELTGGNGHLRGAVPVLTCLADVEPREVAWLWPGRVPMGRIALLVGRPGEGKSFLSLDFASRVSTGSPWPDGSGNAPKGSVILISAEDDPGDTIRPRLDAHHADAARVHLLSSVRVRAEDGEHGERMFTLADLPALEAALAQHRDCKLLIIDPIGSFLGGDTDAHRDNEVRSVLAPVARLAERYGPAVLVVAHRRKSGGTIADDLAIGSRAFTGVARCVWHLTRDPQDKTRRLLLPGKNNLGPEDDGLAFAIAGDPPRLSWEREPVRMNADEALAAETGNNETGGAADEAADWLYDLLSDGLLSPVKVM